MLLAVRHDLLVLGPDFDRCRGLARRFFDQTRLVRYDAVHLAAEKAMPASDPAFWPRLDEGEARNRRTLQALLGELKAYGFAGLDDLGHLKQGVQSKLLHTAAHLLDGFFGIDSSFYSLAHDSHFLDETQRREIADLPQEYWLIRATCELGGGGSSASLRRFEAGSR